MTIDLEIEFKKKAVRFCIIASSLIGFLMSADAARADKRVAFVVGNGAYKNAPQLSSPPIDAIAMATMLRSVGFEVVEGNNLTRFNMKKKLLDFGRRAQCADIAVFFYAGHSITNFLLPVDADINWPIDVLADGIAIDSTLSETMNKAKVKLVFLDASRDNSFAAKIKSNSNRVVPLPTGLVEMRPDVGMLVAFSTGLGQVVFDGPGATISPFTRALISHVAQPGVEIQQAMTEVLTQVNEETNKTQLPWEQANLKGPVFLNPVPGSPSSTRQQYDCKSQEEEKTEATLWRSVDSENAQDLKAYLRTYPKGQFSSLALAMLDSLDRPQPPVLRFDPRNFSRFSRDEADEDKIGLNRCQRRDVQRQLNALGFNIEITGGFDHDTRWVVKRWQAARGYPVSGYLNATQHEALLAEGAAAAAGHGTK